MPAPNKDHEHLDRLRDYYAENKHIPSLQRIAERMGFASKAAASKLLERLEAAGFIVRTPDREAWIPTDRFFERTLVDGVPKTATGGLVIDSHLVQKPSHTVLIQMKDDSMTDARLMQDDHLVVDRDAAAAVGDIVVAIVADQFVVRTLAKDKRGFFLKPGNLAYPVIRPEGSLELYGVVTGSFRKHR